jgi:hypothetical protein
MVPQTKRNSGTSAVSPANFADCLRVPWTTHPRARLSACACLLLCSRPLAVRLPVLAPSFLSPLGLRHAPLAGASHSRLLRCASRPAPRPPSRCLPLSLRARSSLAPRSVLVPRSPLAPYPCLAWVRSERRVTWRLAILPNNT